MRLPPRFRSSTVSYYHRCQLDTTSRADVLPTLLHTPAHRRTRPGRTFSSFRSASNITCYRLHAHLLLLCLRFTACNTTTYHHCTDLPYCHHHLYAGSPLPLPHIPHHYLHTCTIPFSINAFYHAHTPAACSWDWTPTTTLLCTAMPPRHSATSFYLPFCTYTVQFPPPPDFSACRLVFTRAIALRLFLCTAPHCTTACLRMRSACHTVTCVLRSPTVSHTTLVLHYLHLLPGVVSCNNHVPPRCVRCCLVLRLLPATTLWFVLPAAPSGWACRCVGFLAAYLKRTVPATLRAVHTTLYGHGTVLSAHYYYYWFHRFLPRSFPTIPPAFLYTPQCVHSFFYGLRSFHRHTLLLYNITPPPYITGRTLKNNSTHTTHFAFCTPFATLPTPFYLPPPSACPLLLFISPCSSATGLIPPAMLLPCRHFIFCLPVHSTILPYLCHHTPPLPPPLHTTLPNIPTILLEGRDFV